MTASINAKYYKPGKETDCQYYRVYNLELIGRFCLKSTCQILTFTDNDFKITTYS